MKNKILFIAYIFIEIISSIFLVLSEFLQALFLNELISNSSFSIYYFLCFVIFSFVISPFLIFINSYIYELIIIKNQKELSSTLIKKIFLVQNNYFYNKDFLDKLNHLANNSIEEIARKNLQFISLLFLIIKILIYSSITLYSNYIIGLIFIAFFIILFILKLVFSKLDFNKKLSNINEERISYYYLSLLFSPEKRKEIEKEDLGNTFYKLSLDNQKIFLSKKYGIRKKNAFLYNTLKFISILAISLAIFFFMNLKEMSVFLLILTLSSEIKSLYIIDDLNESLTTFFDIKYEFKFFNSFLNSNIFEENNEDSPYFELKNVYFKYKNKYVLKNINLTIKKGETISIIGDNGSGKSTLMSVLLGINKPTKGSAKSINKNVSSSFQDFIKYDGTILENIIFDKNNNKTLNIDDKFLNFVSSKKDGLSTKLGMSFDNGVELSLGEWQKIALTRTFFTGPEIVFLDEPTSSIDPKNEIEFFEYIKDKLQNKTFILITHRIGFATLAKRIIVMKNGKIIEDGCVDELLKLNGEFAKIYSKQRNFYEK